MRYFYHPESECLWQQEDDAPVETDGCVEEVTREEYERLKESAPHTGKGERT